MTELDKTLILVGLILTFSGIGIFTLGYLFGKRYNKLTYKYDIRKKR